MMNLEWTEFKAIVDDRLLNIQYVLVRNTYELVALDGAFQIKCSIRDGSLDAIDFETNYQSLSNKKLSETDTNGVPLSRTRAFANADGMRFRGTGVSDTAVKTTTTNIDYKVVENRFINGLEFILNNQAFGDNCKFQVVDVDGIYYPAGTVLDEFGTDWNLSSDTQRQGPYILPYPALVNANLYLRIVYNSVGTVNDVDVKINYFLHKKSV